MSRVLWLLLFVLSFGCNLGAQCPPIITGPINYNGGVSFATFRSYVHLSTQAEIDQFSSSFPSCTSLPAVLIGDPDNDTDINNLNGLQQLLDMGDVLVMRTSLSDLTGIDVGSNELFVIGNGQLTSLAGMTSQVSIGNFYIADNPLLTTLGNQTFAQADFVQLVANAQLSDITGLNNLVHASLLQISQCPLQNLAGLQNLDSVGISLSVSNCSSLISLTGLSGLRHLSGDLWISANSSLVDVSAIGMLEEVSGKIVINHNESLSDCNISYLCQFLSDGFYADISDNLGACENVDSVLLACGISLECPYHIEVNSQAALDSLLLSYPNCTKINGTVRIFDSDVTDLSGFEQITHIGHQLVIENNQQLSSLYPLKNVSYLGDELHIKNNDLLPHLAGLENITDMRVVFITDNDLLSICNVASICHYLNNLPLNFSYFFNANATGCVSSEVTNACNCVPIVSVQQGDGVFWASDTLRTEGNLVVQNYASYNAPNVVVEPSFEVTQGTMFEIKKEGCDQ